MRHFKNIVLMVALATVPVAIHAQRVDKFVFSGSGMSSSSTNGAKSVSVIGGAKLVVHFGAGSWFSQFSYSASSVYPQVPGAERYWSMRPSVSLGYRFKAAKSRFSLFDGFGETRSKTGDFLPTAVGGVIVKIKGRWGVVTDLSRNSQSWGTSTTLGYRF